MRISIITATYNSQQTIADTIESVLLQTYQDIEYLIIDGASKDSTVEIANSYKERFKGRMRVISEPDNGIYDALNKGIKLATGEVIGFIHADDLLANDFVIEQIAQQFSNPHCDILYGDLHYVNHENTSIVRNWKSQPYHRKLIQRGWMPAHPTLYIRKAIYEKHGCFDTSFKISADYDFILRVFSSRTNEKIVYLPYVMVKMRIGGVSNSNLKNIIRKMQEDLRALKNNNIKLRVFVIINKNLSKLPQILFKK